MSRVVLVGAGHVHMALLGQAERLRAAGLVLTLVDPGSFWFGAQPARVMTGELGSDALRVSLGRSCRTWDVHRCRDRAIGLDARHRRVWLAGGGKLDYDRVSLNVGQEIDDSGFDDPAAGVRVWSAASVEQLSQLHDALAHDCARGARPRVAIFGDGARATEIAAGLSMGEFGQRLRLACYLPGPRLLPDAPVTVSRRAARVLGMRNVDLLPDTAIVTAIDSCVQSRDGRRFPAEHVVLARGYRAARFVHAGQMPAEAGGIHVTARLQSPRDERVFASGGCALLLGRRALELADVERQARVLADNLIACATRRPMKTYRPPATARAVDLAEGRAFAWYGRLWWYNATAGRWRSRRDEALRARLQRAGLADAY
ncbi:NAD(P)/FAD-dependent oxidoreductase [Salinisphaera aquimarina]|uniref:NAD(P)/FAD-dependent oxidoreductase n=1 Tax=Salinisphaera aquimarina TaxID=2094031 RepID=A0ABV7EU50_9GAMM